MPYTATPIIGAHSYNVALRHLDQPRTEKVAFGNSNSADALNHTMAWFYDLTMAELVAETLNLLAADDMNAAKYAQLEGLKDRLPLVEAVIIHGKPEIELRHAATGQKIGLAIRADGRPASAEAQLLTDLVGRVGDYLKACRAEFVAELAITGSDRPALVDKADEAAVNAAGPWSKRGKRIHNEHGADLGSFIMETTPTVEDVQHIGSELDFRRAKLRVVDTTMVVTLRVPAGSAARLMAMDAAEIGALVA